MLLFFSFLFALVFSQSFDFAANATLSNQGQFAYRDMNVAIVNFGNFYNGVFFTTTSTINNNKTHQKDVVAGAFYVGLNTPPTASVSFFDSILTYNQAQTANPFGFSAQAADTFIAKVFLSLEEVNATNATVQTIPLDGLNWVLTNAQVATNGKGLQWITFQGTSPNIPNFSIQISAVFSQVLGLLNVVGNPVITPKSLETIINMTNFPYKNKADSVRLNTVVGMGMSTLSIQGSVTITSGNGTSGSYVHFSNQVLADGRTTTVTINTVDAGNSAMGYQIVDTQITSKFSTAHSIMFVSITFPAGATTVIYDPSLGSGSDYPQITGTTPTNGNGNGNGVGQLTPMIALLSIILVFFM